MTSFQSFFEYIVSERFLQDFQYIRENSYVHPNGFTKLVFPSKDALIEEYRFHIWPEHGVVSDIHNHTSEFYSLVLNGSVQEELFELSAGSIQKYTRYRCTERGLAGQASLIPIETCNLRSAGKRLLQPIAEYHIAMDRYHQVTTSQQSETVTIVMQMAKRRNYSFVVKPHKSRDEEIPLRNPPLSSNRTKELLARCKETISAHLGKRNAKPIRKEL